MKQFLRVMFGGLIDTMRYPVREPLGGKGVRRRNCGTGEGHQATWCHTLPTGRNINIALD